jgi:hypothetical protein
VKKSFLLLGVVILLCGCATLAASSLTASNRMHLSRLNLGMSKPEALAIMGTANGVYSCDLSSTKPLARIRLNSPYRTETVPTRGGNLEIVYYVTNLKDDCVVTDESLTPLVFENSKLIGWGNDFLAENDLGMQKDMPMKQAAATPVLCNTAAGAPGPVSGAVDQAKQPSQPQGEKNKK